MTCRINNVRSAPGSAYFWPPPESPNHIIQTPVELRAGMRPELSDIGVGTNTHKGERMCIRYLIEGCAPGQDGQSGVHRARHVLSNGSIDDRALATCVALRSGRFHPRSH